MSTSTKELFGNTRFATAPKIEITTLSQCSANPQGVGDQLESMTKPRRAMWLGLVSRGTIFPSWQALAIESYLEAALASRPCFAWRAIWQLDQNHSNSTTVLDNLSVWFSATFSLRQRCAVMFIYTLMAALPTSY
ncbi:MAG: hypothetical protein AB7S71_03605 [Dongiaceae bacterium]